MSGFIEISLFCTRENWPQAKTEGRIKGFKKSFNYAINLDFIFKKKIEGKYKIV